MSEDRVKVELRPEDARFVRQILAAHAQGFEAGQRALAVLGGALRDFYGVDRCCPCCNRPWGDR